MKYQFQGATPPTALNAPTLLLRRLACPYLPNTNPATQPTQLPAPNAQFGIVYNPYVTTDYMENLALNDGTTAIANRASQGRTQPYAGDLANKLNQTATPAGQPKNTLFRHNSQNAPPTAPDPTLAIPFNWLVHLDRQLISPMELLHVSGFKPHELTQLFNSATTGQPLVPLMAPTSAGQWTQCYYGQRAPWFDEDLAGGQTHRLYRLFEFLETGNRAAGIAPGGRTPGKVNINNVWDPEIILALLDPGAGNNAYDQNAVLPIWNTLVSQRSTGSTTFSTPGLYDRPFWSLAAGTYPAGDLQFPTYDTNSPPNPISFGVNNTLLRPLTIGALGNTQRLLQLYQFGTPAQQVTHPYLQDQLLTKLFNNVTTRSNVFAVWVTVGFFEVTDDSVRPAKLGAEIGKAENRHIRHRMFAIVDRSNLTLDQANTNAYATPPTIFVNGSPYSPVAGSSPASATIGIPDGGYNPGNPGAGQPAFVFGSYEGIPWNVSAPISPGPYPSLGALNVLLGSNVSLDVGQNREFVNVTGVTGTPNTITANVLKSHSGPVAISPINTLTGYIATTPITVGSGTPGSPITIYVSAIGGTFEGVNWSLTPGTNVVLELEKGPGSAMPAQELATVVGVQPSTVAGVPPTIMIQSPNGTGFASAHTGAFTISYPVSTPGNPGPQASFNMRQVPWVVRYLSIIN
jgi:hypothetical protein